MLRTYPGLERTEPLILKGFLPFSATYESDNVLDVFELEIKISEEFLRDAPVVKETSNRLKDYAHINLDGTFCLGAPFAVQKKFQEQGTILNFIQNQIVPFLYTFCVWKKEGKFPYGELCHGGEGILQFYREDFFKVEKDIQVLRLLKINIEKGYKWENQCPCGSRKSLRTCHRFQILEIKRRQSYTEYLDDYTTALTAYMMYGTEIP